MKDQSRNQWHSPSHEAECVAYLQQGGLPPCQQLQLLEGLQELPGPREGSQGLLRPGGEPQLGFAALHHLHRPPHGLDVGQDDLDNREGQETRISSFLWNRFGKDYG